MATLNPEGSSKSQIAKYTQSRNKLANSRTKAVGKAQCLTGVLW